MTRQSIIDGLGRHVPTRKMRRGLFCALMLGSGMTLGACASHHHHRDQPQDVVVIRDDHGWDHRGYYDHDHHWHGGYYDERHVYHDDPTDWHH